MFRNRNPVFYSDGILIKEIRNSVSLLTEVILGSLLRSLDFQRTYLKVSIAKHTVPEASDVKLPVPYQYRYLKSSESISGAGSSARDH